MNNKVSQKKIIKEWLKIRLHTVVFVSFNVCVAKFACSILKDWFRRFSN